MNKILYILHQCFNMGGTEEHTRLLADEIAPAYEAFILGLHQGEAFLLHRGQTIARFPAHILPRENTPSTDTLLEGILRQVLALVEPDLVHVQHWIDWPHSLFSVIANTGVPLIATLHDYYALTPLFTLEGVNSPEEVFSARYSQMLFGEDRSVQLRERAAVIQRELSRCRLLISPNRFTSELLSKTLGLPIRTVEHGIRPFQRVTNSRPTPNKRLRFGYIGACIRQKGLAVLLQAFASLPAELLLQTELHIFGFGGESLPALPMNTHYHGPYTQQDLPRVLSAIDIGVIPSVFRESYCFTLSELWMGGVPVIASRIGALAERITEGVNGRLFTPGSAPELSAILGWALDNQDQSHTDSWRHWRLPTPRTAREMAREYQALYRGLVHHAEQTTQSV